MSQVIIAGDTSGTITLQAPAVSGSTTLTLPATTATLATLTTPSFATTIGVGGATASASGSGITFPATQSASTDANTLDDYEEGTWTPIDSSGASLSLSGAFGSYVKVGRLVVCSFSLTYPSTANTSVAKIGGLPFTVGIINSVDNGGPSGCLGYVSGSFVPQLHLITGTTTFSLYNLQTATINANYSGISLRGTLTYQVA